MKDIETIKNELREEIRKEVIAEITSAYSDALAELDAKQRIIEEKEKIFNTLIKGYVNLIAAEKAKQRAEQEMRENSGQANNDDNDGNTDNR